jgi:phosphoketolase
MLTLEMAIEKIRRLSPEQRNKVIEFIEFSEFQSSHQRQSANSETNIDQDFF